MSQFDPFSKNFVLQSMGVQPEPPKKAKSKKEKPRTEILTPQKNVNVGLLALDVATNTGFCSYTASGYWSFTPKKGESPGMRLIRFRAKLKEICDAENIKLIVFEMIPIYGKFPNTVGIEMLGVLKLFCEENNINFTSYPAKTIKVQTGNGNASKDDMVAFAQNFKVGVTSDDEADAIILYHLALKDLGL